jgi:hypothetical protein
MLAQTIACAAALDAAARALKIRALRATFRIEGAAR